MSADNIQPQDAPTDCRGILKHLGPGLIVTACIVGSGELIATPKVGADHGFSLLWFIIIGCIIKVFVQVELGRAAVVPMGRVGTPEEIAERMSEGGGA